jgi:hypothetical protein
MSTEPSEKPQDSGQSLGIDDAWEAEEEPVLVGIVRKALARYVGRVPPERLVAYRDALILFITTHPAMAARYERVRTRPVVVAASTGVLKDDAPVLDVPTPTARSKSGG